MSDTHFRDAKEKVAQGQRHTPGPWELSYDQGSTRDVIASSDNSPICTMRLAWITREQYAANSLLVAAAPEMLAMLQELRECADYWSEYEVPLGIVDRMDRVLAKALGAPPQQENPNEHNVCTADPRPG